MRNLLPNPCRWTRNRRIFASSSPLPPRMPDVLIDELSALLSESLRRHPHAFDQLMTRAHRDLRQIAHRERLVFDAGETLSTTALVNEAYLKLKASPPPDAIDRRQFFGIAARAMRQILVDHTRALRAAKRGGGVVHESLSAAEQMTQAPSEDLLALDEALKLLSAANARAAEVVQLRFFAGLGDVEIGALLGIEESTVRRDWLKARGWLFQHLQDQPVA
jgi:RNA polymerase sigma factor (TIGR02999 family)